MGVLKSLRERDGTPSAVNARELRPPPHPMIVISVFRINNFKNKEKNEIYCV
nr:MAG TPA: hypothetical protein [Caudoviricetes sp.]